ncbi:MAG: GAF domain-containing protein [Leptolyngbya sp. DLM2.Bin15]|nr:MAG: GAF domain-containing protein [Leptolyngbya sp. DLM2.Bin15]
MTSFQIGGNQDPKMTDSSSITEHDLFADFITGNPEPTEPDEMPTELNSAFMTHRHQQEQRITDAIAAVEQELSQETEQAQIALTQIKAELETVGALKKPDVLKGVDRLSALVQGVQQGVKGHLSDVVQKQFSQARQSIQQVAHHLRRTQELDPLLQAVVASVQQFLGTERSLIYRFEGSDRGMVVAEALDTGWTPMLSESLPALCFGLGQAVDYQRQQIVVLDHVSRSTTTPYQKQLIDKFQIQSMVVVPIVLGGTPWGLLVAHQCSNLRHWQETDIYYLTRIVAEIIPNLQVHSFRLKQKQWAEQNHILTLIVNQIYQATTVDNVFRTATEEVRRQIKCDRVAIYRFNQDWSGEFIAESVASGWTNLMQEQFDNPVLRANISECSVKDLVQQNPQIIDTYLRETNGGRFSQGEVYRVCNDVYNSDFSQCYIQILERYQAKAYVMVAIYDNHKLWGLMAAYQCSGSRLWSDAEIAMLTQVGTQLNIALQQSTQTTRLTQAVKREQAIAKLVPRILQAKDEPTMFRLAVQELRQLLNCDRVGVYRFTDDWSGEFVSESVASGWVPVVGPDIKTVWEDTHLQETQGGRYAKQESFVVDDIYTIGHSPCHIEILEQFQVKAYMIAPIFYQDKLWGLLGAYQNSSRRDWQEEEVQLLKQIGTQLGVALQQIVYTRRLTETNQREQLLAKIIQRLRDSVDIDDLFKITVREVRRFMKADRVGIFQFYPNTGYDDGEFVAEDVDPSYPSAIAAKIHDHCFGDQYADKYRDGRVQAVADIYNGGLSDCHIDVLADFEVRANLIIPLVRSRELWGLLCVHQCSEPREWTEDEIEFLKRIADQSSIALQQAESTQKIKAAFEQEQALNRVFSRIRQASNLDTIFSTATQEVRRLLGVERVTIYRFRPDFFGDFINESDAGGFPKLVGSGWEDPYLHEHRGGRFRDNLPLVVDDIHTGETIWQNDGFNLRASKILLTDCHIEALEFYQAKSCTVVSIFKGDELWGLLSAFQNTGTRHWTENDVKLMMQVASQMGIAIQQAEATEKLKIAFEQEQALNRVIARIRQSSDLDSIFSTTTQEVRRLLGIERVTIYKFRNDFFGDFINESDAGGFPKLAGSGWEDPYLNEHQGGRFRDNIPLVVDNIHAGETLWQNNSLQLDAPRKPLTDCHVEALEFYQAKSCAVVSIFKGNQLWGLLSAFQNTSIHHWTKNEVNLLMQVATQIGVGIQQAEYIAQIEAQSHQLARQAEREKNYARVIGQIGQRFIERIKRQDLNLEELLTSTTRDVRQALQTDRVGIYRFDPDWSGEFIVEDFGGEWIPLVGTEFARVKDTYLKDNQGGRYRQNQSLQVNNIYAAGHSECHIDLLASWGTKAYMISPIFKGDDLWGLLGAYQNSDTRQWDDTEISLLNQVGSQLGNALLQAEVIEQVQAQSQQLSTLAEQEKIANSQLQQRIVQMLSAVRPALQGDLTVRAPVTEDAVGTIADAYNNTIQSLRKLVTQVKTAASEVGETSQASGGAIAQLTQQTQQELTQITKALQQLASMVSATQSVAQDAQRVETAVQRANETVEQGDSAMNLTVEGILAIRETVSEATKKIKRLSESSQKISKVVSLIGNFTTQTQLLALNAAIEATRAGEYGRGFAVVADEVRSLAQQSSEATGEIETLVQEIQAETSAVSTAMDAGIQQVVQGTHLVTQTRQSLNDIVTATAQIRELIQGITSSTQAQIQQSDAVTQAMNDVAAIAQTTSSNSTQIATSFQALLNTAEDLQKSVGQFRVQ